MRPSGRVKNLERVTEPVLVGSLPTVLSVKSDLAWSTLILLAAKVCTKMTLPSGPIWMRILSTEQICPGYRFDQFPKDSGVRD